MPNKSNKISVSYRLEASVIDMIKELGIKESRSATNLIEFLVRKHYRETQGKETQVKK